MGDLKRVRASATYGSGCLLPLMVGALTTLLVAILLVG